MKKTAVWICVICLLTGAVSGGSYLTAEASGSQQETVSVTSETIASEEDPAPESDLPKSSLPESGLSEESLTEPGTAGDLSETGLSEEETPKGEPAEEVLPRLNAPEEAVFETSDTGLSEFGTSEFSTSESDEILTEALVIPEDGRNDRKGIFKVRLINPEKPEKIKFVEFPVWCDVRQGDIQWYRAEKKTDEDGGIFYEAEVRISNHEYHLGKYKIHCYITDTKGNRAYRCAAAVRIKEACASFTAVTNAKETSAAVSAEGLLVPGGAKEIKAAVWSVDKGQDDLKWYSLTGQNGGSYTVNVPVKNHKGAGRYYVHLYAVLKNGSTLKLAETRFNVTAPSGTLSVTDPNGTKGTFRIRAEGLTAVSGVKKVRFAVWQDKGQKDICWYTAALSEADGICTAVKTAQVAKHQNHFGKYSIHMYVTMGNGLEVFAGKTYVTIKADNYDCSNPGNRPTTGCVAIPENCMITVLKNLRSDARIIIDYSRNLKNY